MMTRRRMMLLRGSVKPYTLTGNPVSFETNVSAPLQSLLLELNPVQDLHGYDNPWPAGGGANIWDEETVLGNIAFNTGEYNGSYTNQLCSKNFCSILPNTQYYIKSPDTKQIIYYDQNKNYVGYKTWFTGVFTTPADAYFFKINLGSYGTTYNHDVAVNYPSSVTNYAPYSNICPITGHTAARVTRTGVNTYHGGVGNTSVGTDGVIHFNMGAYYCGMDEKVAVKGGQDYNIAFYGVTVGTAYIGEWNAAGQFIGRREVSRTVGTNVVYINFTASANAVEIFVYLYVSTQTYTDLTNVHASLTVGSGLQPYSPYAGQVYDIAFPSEAGTVYGGSLDVTTGVLTVDRAIETVRGNISSNGTLPNGAVQVKYVPTATKKPAPSSETQNEGLLSNLFNTSSAAASGSGYVTGRPTNGNIYFGMPEGVTTIEAASTWFANNSTQISFLLATPVEYQLTPVQIATLLGQNNVWADTNGDLTLTYLKRN